jgi:carboxyl-terminal processing protease
MVGLFSAFRSSTVFFMILALAVGAASAGASPKEEATNGERDKRNTRYETLELFQKVLHFIEANYVEEVDNKSLIHGALKGMLETLDPHSNFLPPEIYRDMKIDTSGKYGGLGLEMGVKDNVLTVVAPIEDTPAWRAGVKAGDRIVKINGESTKGMTLTEAVAKMKGKQGTPMKLSLFRKGFSKPKEVTLVRETIKIQAVKWEGLDPGFGYVRLTNFNESAAKDIRKAMEKLEKKSTLKGLVLDLRNNPGGLLDQAVDVSSLFIDEGIVVSTRGRSRDQEIRYAKRGMARKDFPVAILVNSSTASAAEIVAGALQDHHRAIVMGAPTFGKGSVQTVIDLNQDMGLKLTIARYYTPSGKSIQERGVQPDVLLDDFDSKVLAEARKKKEEGVREKDLKGHIANNDDKKEPGERGEFTSQELEQLTESKTSTPSSGPEDELTPNVMQPREDYQVRQALNYLKSYEVFKRLAASELGGTTPGRTVATGKREPSSEFEDNSEDSDD